MNDRILELYCSVDEPQHLAGFTVSFLTLSPNLQVIGEDNSQSFSDATALLAISWLHHSFSYIMSFWILF